MPKEAEILEKLSDAVIEMDEEAAVSLSEQVIREKMDVKSAIMNGLAKGMRKVGELFENETYSIPEVLLCADALGKGMNILKPHLVLDTESEQALKVLICTVEGDIHSIGKNMVKLMLEVGGFEVIDLGEDVNPEKVLEELEKNGGDIVALSTMMTPTLDNMKEIIDSIRKKYNQNIKIMIGGASVTRKTSELFKADGYGESAPEALNEAIRVSKLISKQ